MPAQPGARQTASSGHPVGFSTDKPSISRPGQDCHFTMTAASQAANLRDYYLQSPIRGTALKKAKMSSALKIGLCEREVVKSDAWDSSSCAGWLT